MINSSLKTGFWFRFSIFSNVGMIPAIIAGLDVNKIHQGALNIINKNDYIESLKFAQVARIASCPGVLASNDSTQAIL